MTGRNSPSATPARQRGAVLYVALVLLILMALIGIAGMRVISMQERMSSNYRGANLAFQNAERSARDSEANISRALTSAAGTFAADQEVCSPSFDPASWADGKDTTRPIGDVNEDTYIRRVDRCFAASSRRVGNKQNEETGNIYEITALASDAEDNPSSSAVIDTVFIP
ncbi:pilus assembly PilX family protein [Luteimonas aquatica]|uniref:pilus assembly PilX family protein n=1 Tax=Luteimonas aquatica TaxID=450364 RepID=UPI001F56731A|nr:PilX N-terminal domain-containing pilus assembly protein [Luteimonas aquatica]